MRHMFIMRGAPGSGKSTAIREHGLSDISISLDQFRALFFSAFTTTDGLPSLSVTRQFNEKMVRAHDDAVASRIESGATIILDQTAPEPSAAKRLVSLARKSGYQVHWINQQGDLSDDELLSRNEQRKGSVSYVAPDVVLSFAERVRRNDTNYKAEQVVYINDIRDMCTVRGINADHYRAVVIIGDIQSCASALRSALDATGNFRKDFLYIFCGDLFDRGPDAAGVLRLLADAPDNVIFVEGNHDTHMRRVFSGTVSVSDGPRDTIVSYRQIIDAGMDGRHVQPILDRMVPVVSLHFDGEDYIISHAGVHPALIERISKRNTQTGALDLDLTEVPVQQFILGSSSAEVTYKGRSDYGRWVDSSLSSDKFVQVHGHRNGSRTEEAGPEAAAPRVWNLEHRVEYGGHMPVLVLQEGHEPVVLRFSEAGN